MKLNLFQLLLCSSICLAGVLISERVFGIGAIQKATGFLAGLILFLLLSWLIALAMWHRDKRRKNRDKSR